MRPVDVSRELFLPIGLSNVRFEAIMTLYTRFMALCSVEVAYQPSVGQCCLSFDGGVVTLQPSVSA